MKRRVVVTGVGAVTPLGNNIDDFWKAIREGRSGVTRIESFDASLYRCQIAGEVKDFDPVPLLGAKESRKMARFTQLVVVAALEAIGDSGLEKKELSGERTGVIIGNGIGGIESTAEGIKTLEMGGGRPLHPMTIPQMIGNEAPGNIAIRWHLKGSCYCVQTACASGTDAIGQAVNTIRYGQADKMIAGGTEAANVKLSIAGFGKLNALSCKFNDTPEKASRPFDRDRDGFVIGEGAGVLVLEELESAKARGAKIYAECVGFGSTCDAWHITSPHPEGEGVVRAMKQALHEAGVPPEEVDYINAHGTSTPTNDPIETKAIKKVFREHAYKVKISSTKSMTAHLVGAAGAVEAIISLLAIRDQFIPGTINLENPGEGCDLDYTPGRGVEASVDTVLTESLGFGGHNSALIFKRYES